MSIFGYNPADFYTGRGPLEAGSVGIDTKPTDIIFRCNTITEKDDMMEDFNAGHITSEEAAVLMDALHEYFTEKYDGFKGQFYAGISYRHLFVYSCDNEEDDDVLANLETVPPHDISGENLGEYTAWTEDLAVKIKNIMYEAQDVLKDHEVNKKRIAEGKNPANMV